MTSPAARPSINQALAEIRATELAPTTITTYERIVRRTRGPYGQVLRTCDRSQFYQFKAALIWAAGRRLNQNALSWQQAIAVSNAAGADTHLRAAHAAYRELLELQSMKPSTPKPKNKGGSQRRKLSSLPENWREMVALNTTKATEAAVLTVLAVGCRPSELEKGVELAAMAGGNLKVTIRGSKVGETTGQPRRVLQLSSKDNPITRRLWDLANAAKEGVLVVTRKARKLRTAFAGACRRAGLPHVAPYAARHQFASDMKMSLTRSGDKVCIAQALGHQSTETQKKYGLKRLAKRGSNVVSVEAAVPVREWPAQYPTRIAATSESAAGVDCSSDNTQDWLTM